MAWTQRDLMAPDDMHPYEDDMAVAHTPGPWKVEYVINGAFEIVGTAQGDRCVIAARAQFPRRHKEFVANARLIAAAPDLLIALRRFTTAGTEREMERAHELAEQAIAKTERP